MKQWFGDKNFHVALGTHNLGNNFKGGYEIFAGEKNQISVTSIFYRTAFDENAFLSNHLSGFHTMPSKVYGDDMPTCIGKGFVAVLNYPSAGSNPPEGVVINWMAKTFGSFPSTTISAKQSWTDTFPALKYSDFGLSGPS